MTSRIRHNLITDIPGIRVGNVRNVQQRTGVTALMFDRPVVASGSFLGGAPALRENALLEPEMLVDGIHAIVLSGGSTYGLDATAGVQAWLREEFDALPTPDGQVRVPIVVQASLFDLVNGGDKDWGRYSPYAELGYQAAQAACHGPFKLGTEGAGTGATTATVRGGLGSASAITSSGHTVAALMVVNAVGTATIGDGPHFWSAPFEQDAEFGGFGFPPHLTADDLKLRMKPNYVAGTTIGVIATDATLTKAQAKRLAILAQDGVARGVFPAHLPQDGDAVFGIATGDAPAPASIEEWTEILHTATQVTARAIARGVYEASPLPGEPTRPTWQERFGRNTSHD
ncbi:L-aminopeptidase/D-esterase-like protein [Gluconobacter cerinus]|uniref:P1 family peptidase n=1 Tax=Gluconobacter cerinus TaxID=38307 RepID=UPI002227A5E1|nr:P1 family peptidase [Gluconobacter cerinus]MCW2266997.1 L-aminopeptidase/D-esterase-like protein [Gluconobacter cerinus]